MGYHPDLEARNFFKNSRTLTHHIQHLYPFSEALVKVFSVLSLVIFRPRVDGTGLLIALLQCGGYFFVFLSTWLF